MFKSQVRKPPNISNTHGTANGRNNKEPVIFPSGSVRNNVILSSKNNLFISGCWYRLRICHLEIIFIFSNVNY